MLVLDYVFVSIITVVLINGGGYGDFRFLVINDYGDLNFVVILILFILEEFFVK